MKKRIWELDALRGLFIAGMVLVHLTYDLVDLYGVIPKDGLTIYKFLLDWGGILFFLISGICVTLSTHCEKRGILVFCMGMVCTAVTAGAVLLKLADPSLIIYFGVLHCLGLCMMLWPLFRKLPPWALGLIGAVIIAAGLYLDRCVRVDFPWLIPLGLYTRGFASSDYFPILPNLGYFLVGALLGRTLYRDKESLMPNANLKNPVIRFFLFCGKHSLIIYLLHQVVLVGVIGLILYFI